MVDTPNIIGVLTSGGDSPGMNPCIRSVVRTAASHGAQVIGVMNGYEGLINGEFRPLGPRDVGGIMQRGGTLLQTRRSKRFLEKSFQREAIRNLNAQGIDGLVVIGGEGSLKGAHTLAQQGVRVVGIPGSIDNDIWGTDMAIGVDTAMNTIMDAIDKLRDTATSHGRAFLVEVMGRNCGYLAVLSGIVSGAEMVLTPESPSTVEDVAKAVEDAYLRGKRHAIIIVAEGSSVKVVDLARKLEEMEVGFDTRVTILGHIQRGGSPTAFERMLATRMGVEAVHALAAGQTDVMVALQGRSMVLVPLAEVTSKTRSINPEYFEMAHILSR